MRTDRRPTIAIGLVITILSMFLSAGSAAAQLIPVATPPVEAAFPLPDSELGSYLIEGSSPDGGYSGGMEIVGPFDDQTFTVTWTGIPGRGRGPGYDLPGTFVAGFGGPGCGAGFYDLEGDIEAAPEATVLNGVLFAPETGDLFRQRAFQPQTTPEGVLFQLTTGTSLQPTGTLNLIDDGAFVRVELRDGTSLRVGRGFIYENSLIAAFGDSPTCGVLGFYSGDAGATYEGQWTTIDAVSIYTERGRGIPAAGRYAISGENPNKGGSYTGELVIGAFGGVSTFDWSFGAGDETAQGVGIRRGHLISASFGGVDCGSGVLVQTNLLNLQSYFAQPGADANGYEFALAPESITTRGGDFSGVYTVDEYRLPDDTVLTGTLTITALPPDGGVQLYDLVWTLDTGATVTGIGLQFDTALIYGFDRAPADAVDCGVAGYTISADEIAGVWAVVGGTAVGLENGQRVE